MIELTILLDTDKVEAAIRESWQREFRAPDRYSTSGDRGGAGWQEVMRQVKAYIETLDVSAAIATTARARLDDVVNEVVTIALRERARKRAKEMAQDGSLFGEDPVGDKG